MANGDVYFTPRCLKPVFVLHVFPTTGSEGEREREKERKKKKKEKKAQKQLFVRNTGLRRRGTVNLQVPVSSLKRAGADQNKYKEIKH